MTLETAENRLIIYDPRTIVTIVFGDTDAFVTLIRRGDNNRDAYVDDGYCRNSVAWVRLIVKEPSVRVCRLQELPGFCHEQAL